MALGILCMFLSLVGILFFLSDPVKIDENPEIVMLFGVICSGLTTIAMAFVQSIEYKGEPNDI
jgi:sugar phosphate permease